MSRLIYCPKCKDYVDFIEDVYGDHIRLCKGKQKPKHALAKPYGKAKVDAKSERDLRLIFQGCLESAEKEVDSLTNIEEQVVDAIMSHYKGTEFPSGMAIVHSVRAIYRNQAEPQGGGE